MNGPEANFKVCSCPVVGSTGQPTGAIDVGCKVHGSQSSFPSCEVCGVTLHDGDGRIGKEHPTCWPTCPEQQLATPDETGAITLRMDETEVRVNGPSRIQMSQQEAFDVSRYCVECERWSDKVAALTRDRDAWKQQAEGVNKDLLDALRDLDEWGKQCRHAKQQRDRAIYKAHQLGATGWHPDQEGPYREI